MRLAFLHTVESNQRVFEDAAKALGLPADHLRHDVRADLREAVQQAGAFSPELVAQTHRNLLALAADADAVVITCATLGPAVETLEESPVPVVRADVALARAAGEASGKITVLCAVESTIEPTLKLFQQYAGKGVTSIDVTLVTQLWTLFRAGDLDACYAAIATATNDAYAAGASEVAYAHPWMAPAAKLARDDGRRPLDSVRAALHAAIRSVAAYATDSHSVQEP